MEERGEKRRRGGYERGKLGRASTARQSSGGVALTVDDVLVHIDAAFPIVLSDDPVRYNNAVVDCRTFRLQSEKPVNRQ